MLHLFKKKFFWKISKWKKARPTLKIFGTAISSHLILISFRFLSYSRHFGTSQENQKGSPRSRKIWCNREKKSQTHEVSPCSYLTSLKPCHILFVPNFYLPNSKIFDWPHVVISFREKSSTRCARLKTSDQQSPVYTVCWDTPSAPQNFGWNTASTPYSLTGASASPITGC